LVSTLVTYFNGSNKYEVVGSARDGEEGLRLLRSHTADVVLLDIMMPHKDGFCVLEELARNPAAKPACIVLSGLNQEHVARAAIKKGADFYIVKPFDLDVLARRINELWEDRRLRVSERIPPYKEKNKSPEAFAINILREMPFTIAQSGYTYIKTALRLAIEDKSLLTAVTKCLYPDVAKIHGVTGYQVERAIRHAIVQAWKKGGGKTYSRITGYHGPEQPRPTNSAFIFSLVELYCQHIHSQAP
jgi:two-component system response regulator (stage 0 sporulation protein A)